MAVAVLINDYGLRRDYRLDNGTIITLELDELNDEITFYNGGEKLDGEFCFINENDTGAYLLARMYSPPNFLRMGVGRAAVEFFIQYYGCNIYTRPNDGQVRDDGSHLTEMAPGFVNHLQIEGLIQDTSIDYPSDLD